MVALFGRSGGVVALVVIVTCLGTLAMIWLAVWLQRRPTPVPPAEAYPDEPQPAAAKTAVRRPAEKPAATKARGRSVS